MRIPLEIETHDGRLALDIAGIGLSVKSGTVVDAPGGIKIEYCGSLIRRSFGIPEVLNFIVESSVNIELGLFSAWLYEKVKDRKVTKITVRRRETTDISREGIRNILEEEISIDPDGRT